jgi:hypothetical protein
MNGFAKVAAAVLASAVIATAASAVTFAQFQSIGDAANIRWQNNGAGSNATNGTGGSVYTIASGASVVPGSRNVSFSFLNPALSPFITNVTAKFTFMGSVLGMPASLSGTTLTQDGISGSFSFKTTAPIVIGFTNYAAGSNLLTATFFNKASITGQDFATSAAITASTGSGSTIIYTSDFMSFANSVSRDYAISLTSVNNPLFAAPGKALRSFRANSTGSFSSDVVPEPESWMLLIAGFSLVGLASRRRVQKSVSA